MDFTKEIFQLKNLYPIINMLFASKLIYMQIFNQKKMFRNLSYALLGVKDFILYDILKKLKNDFISSYFFFFFLFYYVLYQCCATCKND